MGKVEFAVRLGLALILLPFGTTLAASVADVGKSAGEYLTAQSLPLVIESPVFLIIFAAMFPALIIGLVVKMVTDTREV